MRPTDRRVLLAEVGVVPPPTLGRSAMKMARSRARQRLRVLVEKPGSWVASPLVYLRHKMAGRPAHERALMYPHLAEGAIAVMVAMTMTVTTAMGGSDSDGPLVLDGIQGGAFASLDLTGGDGPRTSTLTHSYGMSDISSARGPDTDPHSGQTGWDKDPLYARETAEHVQKDAEQLGKDAEQLGNDAKQLGKDAEFLVGLLQQDAENLLKEGEFLVGLAKDEAKRMEQVAKDLLP